MDTPNADAMETDSFSTKENTASTMNTDTTTEKSENTHSNVNASMSTSSPTSTESNTDKHNNHHPSDSSENPTQIVDESTSQDEAKTHALKDNENAMAEDPSDKQESEEMKRELAARLRKRLEQKGTESTTSVSSTSPPPPSSISPVKKEETVPVSHTHDNKPKKKRGVAQTACDMHKRRHERCPPNCKNRKDAHLQSSSEENRDYIIHDSEHDTAHHDAAAEDDPDFTERKVGARRRSRIGRTLGASGSAAGHGEEQSTGTEGRGQNDNERAAIEFLGGMTPGKGGKPAKNESYSNDDSDSEEEIEGFRIISDDTPHNIPKKFNFVDDPLIYESDQMTTPIKSSSTKSATQYPSSAPPSVSHSAMNPPPIKKPLSPDLDSRKPGRKPGRRKKFEVSLEDGIPHYSSQRPGSNSIFGPQVVTKALKEMGGRATAVELTEWLAERKPEYVTYFGDKKKLRYSIVGILSARSYRDIFVKEIVIEKGSKRADWILLKENIEESHPELKTIEYNEEDSLNGLLSLRNGSTPPVEKTEGAVGAPLPDPYEVKNCSLCGLGTDDDKLLLCDNCDSGYHMYCLRPPLTSIPTGLWYCKACTEQMGDNAESEPEISEEFAAPTQEYEPMAVDDEMDEESVPTGEPDGSYTRACERHRKWKKRCPPNCPERTIVRPGSKLWTKYSTKRKASIDEYDEEGKIKRTRNMKSEKGPEDLTYIDMIAQSILDLGGSGTTTDITNQMERKYGDLLATKTRTWKNSVSGCLSTHFIRIDKDADGKAIWALDYSRAGEDDGMEGEEDWDNGRAKGRRGGRRAHPPPMVPSLWQ